MAGFFANIGRMSRKHATRGLAHLAIGTAISGIALGCGLDPQLVLDQDGKVKRPPETDRRIETYTRQGVFAAGWLACPCQLDG
jgi:hypothetical protein